MKNLLHHIILLVSFISLTNLSIFAQDNSAKTDTTGTLIFPFQDEGEFEYPEGQKESPLHLSRPNNIKRHFEYDPETQEYIIYEKVGDMYYRMPKSMSLKEFVRYDFDRSIKEYWRTRKETEDIEVQQGGLIPQLRIESEAFSNIFGSEVIDIRPQGYVEVQFGLESNFIGNDELPERLKRTTTFDFENQINVSVAGKIGDKVNMNFNYNTEASFDFENKMKLDYTGKEDEILRRIEAGNVSLPLNGSLIQGGTNLFGIKTEMQFGKLNVTTVVSQHKGESQTIETEGGAQKTEFKIKASDYDENRHFFLSKYFHDHYDESLRGLPLIRSRITINRIEVWVTNKNQNFNSARDIVGFVDLGEIDGNISNTVTEFYATGASYPSNGANNMYSYLKNNYSGIRNSSQINKVLTPLQSQNFENGKDWQKIDQARKLSESEYTLNAQLGFISLNAALNNDEVLAIAYNYTMGGETYQVGEFTDDGLESSETLILKLIKGTSLSPQMPTWDLMMKNIYNLGAYDLSAEDFEFQVVYKEENTGAFVNYLPEGELKDTVLLRFMNLDGLNSQLDATPNGDGMFDYIEGITVYKNNGRVIFPVLEPFGSHVANNLSDPDLKEKYAFTKIYDDTKTQAELDLSHDRFYLIGSYKGSSGSEIMLNAFNLAPGSVTVSAGGLTLTENEDYTVDYALGRVSIINESLIEAGTPIQVSTESQELISTQRKTMIGSYASYAVSDKLNIGGTMLWMNERPVTNKVDLGEEPVTNMMLGLDFQYRDRSRLLTDAVNLLPFYDSDVESSISVEGEVAKLITGNSRTTGNQVYLDDFEGVETPYSMMGVSSWSIASTPQDNIFPEAQTTDSLIYGYNRAKLAWYYIDRTVFNQTTGNTMPDHLKLDNEARKNHYYREIWYDEIYPGKELAITTPPYITPLNIAYYPREKGPYNYDAEPVTGISAGVDQDGKLKDPESRWGGMMREIVTPNFEAANVEYIEFWVLDPFIYNEDGSHKGGDLYFNLGNVSEDILKDSRKSFENGLPVNEIEDVDSTAWGRVSTKTQLGDGFETVSNSREFQDIGLDGLNDNDEATYFQGYLNKLQDILSPTAFEQVAADPSNDNFRYYRGTDWDEQEASLFERYKNYNNSDGNSPVAQANSDYSEVGKTGPDLEDINDDNTLSETESYYQYRVSLRPEDMEIGNNFIVDKALREITYNDNTKDEVYWYQFKIPVQDSTAYQKIGQIYDFKSIRFMRMFLSGFEDSIILRMGTFNLVRADWRKETVDLTEEGGSISSSAEFEMTSINIEENSNRTPINYILPPDIEREIDPSNPQPIKMNEQSMLLRVKDLEQGDARAVYKNLGVDMRQYSRLLMEVHAEAIENEPLSDNELSLFVRLGSDRDNYYEYEIPLKITPVPNGSYNEDNEADQLIVWPKDNRLDLVLDKFPALKMRRDDQIRAAGSTLKQSDIFEEIDDDSYEAKNIIRVKGNPSIGEVDLMYIGVKNPLEKNLEPRSIEVWVNELRMSDFDEKGGWASNGRVSLRLADLASISVSGQTQSVGWGSINQAASQRSLENRYQFDFAATTELGKLLPEKVGLNAPLFYSISKTIANPEYNPLSSDVKMTDALAAIVDPGERDTLLMSAQDVVTRKSFNINNVTLEPVRKKKDRKPLPTDIENFSVSYSKNEQLSHNIDVEKDLRKVQKGVFNYNYSMRSKPITPLKNVDFLKHKSLKLLSDFNFSYLPEMISFRTDLTRNYVERTSRNNTGLSFDMPTTVQKDFLWNRYFDFRYNLTRALSIDFNNKNVSRIDELDGVMDKDLYPDEYSEMMAEIYKNMLSFGRAVDYEHSIKINYRIPINKLPLLDWTTASVNYTGDYSWAAGPQLAAVAGDEPIDLGNYANNAMNLRANGQLSFTTLYNKVPYLKKINSKYKSSSRSYGSRGRSRQSSRTKESDSDKPKRTKEVKYIDKNISFRADVPKSIFHRLGTKDVVISVLNSKGDTINGELTIVDGNRINFKPASSIRNAKVKIVGKKEIDETIAEKALGYSVRALMGVRTVRATYTKTGGTELPGFLPEPYLFGANRVDSDPDDGLDGLIAPTIPWLLGWQDPDFALVAAENGWISTDNTIQKQYFVSSSENWNFAATIEPIPNIKIDVTGTWRESQNASSFIEYDDDNLNFALLSGKESGNFNMSILTIKTAFSDNLNDTIRRTSPTFETFRHDNLRIIADRLNAQRGWEEGVGYGKNIDEKVDGVDLNSTDVIIPAFIAAYTGQDARKIPLTSRPGLSSIRPNWRLNYRGNPQQVEWMKDIFHSFNITHNYKSTYSIGNYETNLAYAPDENGLSWSRLEGGSFVPQMAITSINIQEAFNPLIDINLGFINDMSTNMKISRTRNLNFDFANLQLNETIKNEYSIGFGYRFTGLDMIVRSRAGSEEVSNDINLKFDLTSSNYKNTLRKMDPDIEDGEVNGGAKVMSLDFSADYMASDKLTVKLYYQYNINTPHTTNNGYTRSNTKFGLSFNFSIM